WESDDRILKRQKEADARVAEIEQSVRAMAAEDERRERESRSAEQARRQADEQSEKEWIQKALFQRAQALLRSFSFSVNSAGGLEPTIYIKNISEKRIKYTAVEVRIFNPVGDPAPDKFGADNLMAIRLVGPIESMDSGVYSFDSAVYYNNTAVCGEVQRVTFEFTDGTTYTSTDLKTTRTDASAFKVKGECKLQ
ncbi:MAG: hypothetical protein O3B41_02105, partial [Bacteroidetes bacterium]|nr:hypothetical protein [Bacteroidota bacterium]